MTAKKNEHAPRSTSTPSKNSALTDAEQTKKHLCLYTLSLGALLGGPLGWLLKFGFYENMGFFICGLLGFILSLSVFPFVLNDEKHTLSFKPWLMRVFIFRVLPTAIFSLLSLFLREIPRYSNLKTPLSILLGTALGAALAHSLLPLLKKTQQKTIIDPYGITWVLLFIFLWFLPILWVGGFKKSVAGHPPFMQNLYRISCLFTHSSSSWQTAHFQIQYAEQGEWFEAFENDIFEQQIFGYRTRFNRILSQGLHRGRKGQKRLRKMAEYIRDRWAILHPNAPSIIGVRYIRIAHPINGKQCMANEKWHKYPLTHYSQKSWRIEATINLTHPFQYRPKKSLKKPTLREEKHTFKRKVKKYTPQKRAQK